MASGGRTLREMGGGLAATHVGQFARVVAGGTVLALVTGIWACLWLPRWPIF